MVDPAATAASPPSFLNAFLENDNAIVAVSRDPAGRRKLARFPAEYVSYHETAALDAEVLRGLRASRFVKGIRVEGKWTRIAWANESCRRGAIEDEASPLVLRKVAHYEADLSPLDRWMVDAGVRVATPRRCYVDIETDSRVSLSERRKMRVLCWTLTDDSKQVVARGRLDQNTDADERRVLLEFWRVIEPYDQVACWNGSFNGEEAFDFDVLWLRSAERRVEVDARQWLWVDQMPAFDRHNKMSAKSGDEKRSLKLNDIAQAVVGVGKEVVPPFVWERFGDRAKRGLGALAWDLWEAGGEFRELLFRYNERDALLLPMIEAKKSYLGVSQAVAEVTGVFLTTRGLNPIRQVDAFMLRFGREQGHHFPTKPRGFGLDGADEDDQFEGAFVLKPRCIPCKKSKTAPEWTAVDAAAWRKARGLENGILSDVHVLDFSGMYPSIFMSWNMSIETRALQTREGPVPEGFTRARVTDYCFSLAAKGMVPEGMRRVRELRAYWKKQLDLLPQGSPEWVQALAYSTAYKVVANSFYGVVGSRYGRYFDPNVAESCTQTGAFMIKAVIAAAEQRGWSPVYTDTDSLFVLGPSIEEFEGFVAWCNAELIPGIVFGSGCRENFVAIGFEKTFSRLSFSAGKRYIGRYSFYDGKPAPSTMPPEIKGIEYKRGDSLRLTADLQAEVIDMLVGGLGRALDGGGTPTDDLTRYSALLIRHRRHVLEEPLTVDEVAKSKKLTRAIREYKTKVKKDGTVSSLDAHVRVAQDLRARGIQTQVGSRVEYVVADAEASPARVIPAMDYDGSNVDRHALWEEVVASSIRILEGAYPNHDWARWEKSRPPKRSRPLPGQLAFDDSILLNVEAPKRPLLVPGAFAAASPANGLPARRTGPRRWRGTEDDFVRVLARLSDGEAPAHDRYEVQLADGTVSEFDLGGGAVS